MELTPYSLNNTAVLPVGSRQALQPGRLQGVHLTMESAHYDRLLEKIEGWFRGRDEVTLVDYGVTDKQGLGYIIMEWEGYEVDPLFLAILRDDEAIMDYVVYSREVQ